MHPSTRLGLAAACVTLIGGITWTPAETPTEATDPLEQNVTQGALRVKAKDGGVVECPLKHTDVKAEISGFIARVTVTQTFQNPYDEKIEAVYVFPLPHEAAVDDMTMLIGDRRIVGLIKRRAEARQIYEQALAQGTTAALLEQERPNIFTQSVGNIPPKGEVRIVISYVDVLAYDLGTYTFHFPMVVGPRYIPGAPTTATPTPPSELQGKVGAVPPSGQPAAPSGTGWAPDTARVPDASRITPPVLKPGFRTGHDISLSVRLDAGVPIQALKCPNHEARLQQDGPTRATAELSPADSVPNKDFVLTYNVVGRKPEMAVLTHTEGQTGYFMLMVQPREDEALKQSPPRELVFLVDVSGSMSGEPTEKIKQTMGKLLRLCKTQDTVQVITFAGQAQKLFASPVPCTEENIGKALAFTDAFRGGGGTEMLKGVKLAIEEPVDAARLRIVIMLTDGFIGNEAEIIAAVGRGCGDRIRFWCIGIGSSPNRFLLDGVAKQGGGMAKVIGLRDDPGETTEDIMTRIHRAQLADIHIDWGGVEVMETYPAKIPELWAGRPVIVFGLYRHGRDTTLTVRGNVEGQAVSWPLPAAFPAKEPANDVLAKVWARKKIEDLMQQTYYAGSPEVEELVTSLALEYRLMSQYTSFVAVDEKDVKATAEPPRPPRRMLVPVPLPEGVSYEGVFGADRETDQLEEARPSTMPSGPRFRAASHLAVGQPLGVGGFGSGLSPLRMKGLYARRSGRAAPASAPAPSAVAVTKPQSVLLRRSASRTEAHYFLDADSPREGYYSGGWNRGDLTGGELSPRVAGALAEADRLRSNGAVSLARPQYALAYLLAAANGDGAACGKAQTALEEIDGRLLEQRLKDTPALSKTLDVIVRDQSVPAALAAIAKAAGLRLDLLPGSEADAAAARQVPEARVTYLDLRRATAAQALDWLLIPNRLTWWVEGGTVRAGSARRAPGLSAWVYDVSLLALPSEAEIKPVGSDHEKRSKLVTKTANEFLDTTAKALGLKPEALAWFGPGQLLIFTDPAHHAQAAALFADLATLAATVPPELASLQKATAARAQAGRAAAEAAAAERQRRQVLAALDEFSWRLIAAAAQGTLDLEALTELQAAWASPRRPVMHGQPQALIPMRALWAITESARALPREAELAAFAKTVQDASAKAVEALDESLAKSPADSSLALAYLYSGLAADPSRSSPRLSLFAGSPAPLPLLAAALLGAPQADTTAKLAQGVTEGVTGEDATVLLALACRRTGGSCWDAFRASARDLLGNQPLPGAVVVLVNRLAQAPLPMLARAQP